MEYSVSSSSLIPTTDACENNFINPPMRCYKEIYISIVVRKQCKVYL
jgi:hypothetical protein